MNALTSSPRKWSWITGCAIGCLALGTASGLSTMGGADTWYQALVKPPGTPPGWIFGPVWSALYLMMGAALGRLISTQRWPAVRLFAAQFLLNLTWTPLFFGAHLIAISLGVILTMWLTVLLLILKTAKNDRVSSRLLIPYLLWLSYASYLNAAIFWLN